MKPTQQPLEPMSRKAQTIWICAAIAAVGLMILGQMTVVEDRHGCESGWFGIETPEQKECALQGLYDNLGIGPF